ncbi:P-loop NTPase [Maridesulfovibrio salexigens]|uniref:Cobyrinic acid ac-diamide synthase n=1 Tax=Maridesulfovibrio salexigens (strain ATCC 14822 / DSM 2638 / NCIMB 8403 / VKM B-1763) TaxID=526222 RepID=C6BY40_MARSD|nr:ATP-binding protein [Maridesulfovibrio salexigens]ACS80570.1 Cobyrinic acid ac-diamide synthase [Maridesulfovibrio salexigens DSM 2638]
MKIAIASGKGGTGKTTVAVNFAAYLDSLGKSVSFTDCDVEEPNAHFFLNPDLSEEKDEFLPVPAIDEEKCLGESCRKCIELCRFKSLIWMVDSVLSFSELCHGCGLCELACPADAISEGKRLIGTTSTGKAGNIDFTRGLLRIGEAMSPPLIKAVKNISPRAEINILDCPPGTSCPVVESIDDTDFVVLVTEPTPFGLHDLNLAVQLMQTLNMPCGVVINRAGMGDDRVEKYLAEKKVPLLGSLPHSREAASSYSKGDLLYENIPGFKDEFARIWSSIQEHVSGAQ